MAFTKDTVNIGGVQIKIATGTYGGGTAGKTQTVNVFDDTQTEGNYRAVYRLQWEDRLEDPELLERFVRNLNELDRYLIARGAVNEGSRSLN